MTKLLLITLIISSYSCSTYRPPEAFEAKMNRFSANSEEKNIVPELYTQPLLLEKGRAPASINPNKYKPLNYSNKILYFMGLHGQYNAMRTYASASTPIVKSCPHFHSTLLGEKNKKDTVEFISPKGAEIKKISNLYRNAKNNPGLFPELHLPMEKNNLKNTIFSNIKNDKKIEEIPYQIQTAINLHLEKTYGELSELCSTGTSANYFIYENLTRLQKSKKFDKNEQTLKAFFKTTVISNMAILSSLQDWKQHEKTPELNQISFELIKRLNGTWVGMYLSKLVQERRKLTSSN